MSDRIPLACPKCRSALKVRAEFFGRELECKRCQHRFDASMDDVIDPTTLSAESIALMAAEKVAVECPECRRVSMVRKRYLGVVIGCKGCSHRFLAAPGSASEPGRSDVDRAGVSRRREDGLGRKHHALERKIGRLAGKLQGVEARLEGLFLEKPGRDEGLERAIAELGEHRRDFAALEASFSAFHAEFEAFRAKAGSEWEAERRASVDEIAARLDGERDLARRGLERLQLELEGLRRQHDDLSGLEGEAETRSMALGSRLNLLEEAARHGLERETLLEGRLRGLEGTEADRGAILEDFGRFRDQDHSLRQAAANQAEEFRAGLAALWAEHASIRRAIEDHEGRRGHLESGLASLEASRLEGLQGVVRREEFEAGTFEAREEIERVRERLRQAVDHQVERYGRLEQGLASIESERASYRHEVESLRGELEAMRGAALAEFERSRLEVAGLLAELEKRTSMPSPVASAPNGPRTGTPATSSPPASTSMGPSALLTTFNFDQLAQDLVLDRIVRDGGQSRPGGSGVPESPNPKAAPAPAPPEIPAEYQQLSDQFARSINRGDQADAIATARRLVDYCRVHYGDRRIELALWMRNLGVALTTAGELTEARALLHHALEICQDDPKSDQPPRAICLIDLAELYLAGGDRRQAKAFGLQAMEALKKLRLGPNNPLLMRAQGCMARIGSTEPAASRSFLSTSIST